MSEAVTIANLFVNALTLIVSGGVLLYVRHVEHRITKLEVTLDHLMTRRRDDRPMPEIHHY